MSQAEPNEPMAAEPNSGPTGKIAELAAQAGINQPQPQGEQGNIDANTDKELTVDVGGVQRTVKMSELTKAFNERETTAKAKELVEARLAEFGDLNSVRQLKQTIESLDGTRRSKVMSLILNQSDPDEDDSDDAFARAVFDDDGRSKGKDGGSQQGNLPREVVEKLGFLEKAVMSLATEANQRFETQKKATLETQVNEQMNQYPLFAKDKVAAALAKDGIMAMLAADQSATPEKVVRSAAGKLQELLNARRQDDVERLGGPRTMVQESERKILNAEGLKSGMVRRLAEQVFSGNRSQT